MTRTETIHDVLETGGKASRNAIPGTYEEKYEVILRNGTRS